MNILEYAFNEGRDTKISWNNSESLKKAHVKEIQINNLLNVRKYKGLRRKIAQIHAETGKVINVFENSFSAARWIAEKKYHITDSKSKKAYSCHGNIRTQLVKGQKAYNYYWMLLDPDSKINVTYTYTYKRKSNKGKIYMKTRKPTVLVDNNTGKVFNLASRAETAQKIGIDKGTLRWHFRNKNTPFDVRNFTVYTKTQYSTIKRESKRGNPKPLILGDINEHYIGDFSSYSEAANYFNVRVIDVIHIVRGKRDIDGYRLLPA